MIRLLLVEDEDAVRQSLLDYVPWHTMGIAPPAAAGNGEIALRLFDEFHPQIVLTDISMPGRSGIEMAREMLAKNETVRFIFISAYSEVEYLQQALRMGSTDYLIKPLSLDELQSAIRRACESLAYQKRVDGGIQLLSKHGDQLLIPLLKRILLGEDTQEALQTQLTALSGNLTFHTVQLFWMNGVTGSRNYEQIQPCFASIKPSFAVKRFLIGTDNSTLAYILLLASPLDEAQTNDFAQRLLLQLQIMGYINAGVSFKMQVSAIMGLYAAVMLAPTPADNEQNTFQISRRSNKDICKKIQEHITQNYTERTLSAGSIAKTFYYSSAYICTLFKKEKGITIHEYINQYRIARAKKMLLNTSSNLGTIAQNVGYDNESYFSRVFKNTEGLSPSEYRQNRR